MEIKIGNLYRIWNASTSAIGFFIAGYKKHNNDDFYHKMVYEIESNDIVLVIDKVLINLIWNQSQTVYKVLYNNQILLISAEEFIEEILT